MGKRRSNGSLKKVGDNKYQLRVTIGYNDNGNPNRRTKVVEATSDRQAEKKLALFINELQSGMMVKPSKLTFKQFVYDQWLPYQQKHLEYNTLRLYLQNLEQRFIPAFGRTFLQDVSIIQLISVMDHLKRLDGKQGPVSRSTARNTLAAAKSVFNLAKEWNVIQFSPADNVKIGKDKREKTIKYKPYKSDEITQIFTNVLKEDLELQVILMIAIITGARVGEIAALEEKHISFKENSITFEQIIIDKKIEGATLKYSTKTDVTKVVSIPDELMNIIKQLVFVKRQDRPFINITSKYAKNKFLFCNADGKPYRVSTYRQRWKRFVKRYDMRYVRFHDLRHTSATWLINQDVNMKVVQERLGHKDILTTMNIYAHVLKETDQLAANSFKTLY